MPVAAAATMRARTIASDRTGTAAAIATVFHDTARGTGRSASPVSTNAAQ